MLYHTYEIGDAMNIILINHFSRHFSDECEEFDPFSGANAPLSF